MLTILREEEGEMDNIPEGIIDVENVHWEMGSNYDDRSVYIPKHSENTGEDK